MIMGKSGPSKSFLNALQPKSDSKLNVQQARSIVVWALSPFCPTQLPYSLGYAYAAYAP